MKNTIFLENLGITFDPYRYFPESIKTDPEKIVELYKDFSLTEMNNLLHATKTSTLALLTSQEDERDQITFALFKRIESSNPDALPVDSVLLEAKDPATVKQLEFNQKNHPANLATLGFIKANIPSRHMRGFYQITLEAGFLFERSQILFRTLGYDRELFFLNELNSKKVA